MFSGCFQPDTSKSHVNARLIWETLSCPAECHDGHVGMIAAGITEPQGNMSFDSRRIQHCERLELLHFLLMTALARVEFRKLFARGCQRRLQRDSTLESLDGLEVTIEIAQAQTHQIVGLGKALVEAYRLTERRERCLEIANSILRKAKLVEHPRRLIVQTDIGLVGFNGGRIAS